MCLILFGNNAHPRYRFVLAANRDEFFARPTAPAQFWQEAPHLLAGRDLQGGGSWLGITRSGRIAALSNYREFPHHHDHARSRGELPVNYLVGGATTDEYLNAVTQNRDRYSGFNLLFGAPDRLVCASNRGSGLSTVPSGIHGLSNHLLDTPWPKVRRGVELLSRQLAEDKIDPEAFFTLLTDRSLPPDDELPDTGVGLEWERTLAPLFITSPDYGTRASTVLLIEGSGRVTFMERTFNAGGEIEGTGVFQFRIYGSTKS